MDWGGGAEGLLAYSDTSWQGRRVSARLMAPPQSRQWRAGFFEKQLVPQRATSCQERRCLSSALAITANTNEVATVGADARGSVLNFVPVGCAASSLVRALFAASHRLLTETATRNLPGVIWWMPARFARL